MVHVPALDVGHVTAALSRRGGAGVVAAAAHHPCCEAVAAAGGAPVNPQRAAGQPVQPHAGRAARTCGTAEVVTEASGCKPEHTGHLCSCVWNSFSFIVSTVDLTHV